MGHLAFDFKSVRDRIQNYKWFVVLANLSGDKELIWTYTLLINELEREIENAHQSLNRKMTTVTSSGHPLKQFENKCNLILPHQSLWEQPKLKGAIIDERF